MICCTPPFSAPTRSTQGRGRAAAAALLPLPAYEPECFACIVSHTKLSALAAADACRPAAPSQSPDGALPQGMLLLSRCFNAIAAAAAAAAATTNSAVTTKT